ncbi:unnamed protein product, partial [Polarella glacialis]
MACPIAMHGLEAGAAAGFRLEAGAQSWLAALRRGDHLAALKQFSIASAASGNFVQLSPNLIAAIWLMHIFKVDAAIPDCTVRLWLWLLWWGEGQGNPRSLSPGSIVCTDLSLDDVIKGTGAGKKGAGGRGSKGKGKGPKAKEAIQPKAAPKVKSGAPRKATAAPLTAVQTLDMSLEDLIQGEKGKGKGKGGTKGVKKNSLKVADKGFGAGFK